eukprot:gene5960-6654_t
MFSQNVVDPREFLSDVGHGESLWDSQQNSQAWSYSQSSNSQMGHYGGNSQGNRRHMNNNNGRNYHQNNNNFRSNSGGSDYWSQSQNVSDLTQEKNKEEDGKYHLNYLNKPPLFGKKSEEMQPVKSFHQYVELQKKASIEDETRSKLESISKLLEENSHELRGCIGELKSELEAEFGSISESIAKNTKESSSIVQRLTEDIKESLEANKSNADEMEEKASHHVVQLKSTVKAKDVLIEQLKQEVEEAKEREKALLEKEVTYNKNIHETLQVILSRIIRQVSKSEIGIQTVASEGQIDSSTQTVDKNAESDTISQASQTDAITSTMPLNAPLHPEPYKRTDLTPLYGHSHYPAIATTQKLQHLIGYSPVQKNTIATDFKPHPSPVATVAPMIQADKIKQEEIRNEGDCSFNVKRPKLRRTPLKEKKKDDPASIFYFDISNETDSSSSEDASQDTDCNLQYNTKSNHAPSSLVQPQSIQAHAESSSYHIVKKPITTYGKIKKDNSMEWVKNRSGKGSPLSVHINGNNALNKITITDKSHMKAKTRVTSRGCVAKMRKEYAEKAFKFNGKDDLDLKNIQMAFKKSNGKSCFT